MATSQIIINGKNCVQSNTKNSKYRYYFRSPEYFSNEDSVALSQCNIYYSWRNITSTFNNNTFSYKWFGALATDPLITYTITIPDGYYSISDLNEYLITVMTNKGHYVKKLLNNVTTSVYYISIAENSTYYGCQLTFSKMESTAPTDGYTYSNGASLDGTPSWSRPSTAQTPQLIFSSTNSFNELIGFSAGTYPSTLKTSNYTLMSNLTPTINPISSIFMTCNLIRNGYTDPDNVLYAFTSGDISYGSMIEVKPQYQSWTNIVQSTYSYVEIGFYDQDNNVLSILDTDITIILTILRNSKKR